MGNPITNPLVYATPIFVLLIVIELVISLKYNKKLYQWKDLAASTTMGFGATLLAIGAKLWSIFLFFAVYRLFNKDVNGVDVNIMGWKSFGLLTAPWYIWVICQFLDDFCYYWVHRLNHEVRFMWAAHIVHHSSEKYNLGTGIRNGWVTLVYKPFFYMWLCALGFHPFMVTTCLAIEAIWQFQLHSQLVPRLGFLEKFMNTHKHHMVHHSSNLEYLDKNHGGYLNIFDRIFGTFKDLDEENIETTFGVLKPPNSYNPLIILTHEYKNIWDDVRGAKSLKEVFMYIFGPPGWSPDGSTKTVKQIQRELKEQAVAAQTAQVEEKTPV